jgi:hypothetical protein
MRGGIHEELPYSFIGHAYPLRPRGLWGAVHLILCGDVQGAVCMCSRVGMKWSPKCLSTRRSGRHLVQGIMQGAQHHVSRQTHATCRVDGCLPTLALPPLRQTGLNP